VIAIGGAGADPSLSVDVEGAAQVSLRALERGVTPLEAAVEGLAMLEDNPSFNAGLGSSVRRDGTSIQMDALVMDSEGRVGGVAGIVLVRHPVRVAWDVAVAGHGVMGGPGALGFARDRGHVAFDPWTPRAHGQWEMAMSKHRAEGSTESEDGTPARPARATPESASTTPHNAVVLLRTQDGRFAAAASDGGMAAGLPGGIGAVPIPGAAVFVGPDGAVAVSGPSHALTQRAVAHATYERMVRADSPRQAVSFGLEQVPGGVPVAAAAVSRRAFHVGSRGPSAWASLPPASGPRGGTVPR
jgi:L-asparaginase/beta-aspartyl-peptidase (threonine type)